MDFETLKRRDEAVVCHTYGRYPLAVAEAHGCRLRGLDGKEYVDLLAGLAVVNLGHSRPELVETMAEQATRLVHVSNLFYTEQAVILAEKLTATSGADKVFFCNSGAEANEAAVKLARRYQCMVKDCGRRQVVTLSGSFHGRTLAMVAATGQDKVKEGFDPLPEGFVTAAWRDIEDLRRKVGPDTAAVMVEVVQGEGGVKPMEQAYASAVQDLCRERGVLLIVDEIQTGLGRTGRLWAHQHYGLTPDIFTSAKGLANGLPMGAMLCTDAVAAGFAPGAHATTFGGGPVLAAVACRVLELLEEEKLVERAEATGAYILAKARELMEKLPEAVAEARGLGLMVGIRLAMGADGEGGGGVDPQAVWKALLEAGFVTNLTQGDVIRLLPPLTIPLEDIDAFFCALEDILSR